MKSAPKCPATGMLLRDMQIMDRLPDEFFRAYCMGDLVDAIVMAQKTRESAPKAA